LLLSIDPLAQLALNQEQLQTRLMELTPAARTGWGTILSQGGFWLLGSDDTDIVRLSFPFFRWPGVES
jgi:hypothetical protein